MIGVYRAVFLGRAVVGGDDLGPDNVQGFILSDTTACASGKYTTAAEWHGAGGHSALDWKRW
jgi:hypothetical protein